MPHNYCVIACQTEAALLLHVFIRYIFIDIITFTRWLGCSYYLFDDAHDADVQGNGGKILFECICFPTPTAYGLFYSILTICCDYGFGQYLVELVATFDLCAGNKQASRTPSNRIDFNMYSLIIIQLIFQLKQFAHCSQYFSNSSWHGSVYKMVASLARQLMLELKHMWNACTSLRSIIRSELSGSRGWQAGCILSGCTICGHIKSSARSISRRLWKWRKTERRRCTRQVQAWQILHTICTIGIWKWSHRHPMGTVN